VAWWFAVVEARHEIQNPTSAEKIRLLGRRLGLGPSSQVLDIASGRGGPAIELAQAFGCRVTCIERSAAFMDVARERVRAAGLEDLIELVHADAAAVPLEAGRYDAALCLGASFVWNGLDPTLRTLLPTVTPAGFVAVGEPYWRRWPLPEAFAPEPGEDFLPLAETAARFEACGLELVTTIVSSEDDWDRYETLHWLALDEWLRANPAAPEAAEFAARGRRLKERYLRWERDLLGWAIWAGRPARPSLP
jgi:hypothetical protein